MKKYWFKAKDYGWGWYPSSWEGWLVLAVWLAVFLFLFRDTDSASHSVSDTMFGMILPSWISIAILIAICYATGEKPEWRWGDPRRPAPPGQKTPAPAQRENLKP